MKQAFVHELNDDYNSALKIYESIKKTILNQMKDCLLINIYHQLLTDKPSKDGNNKE